MAKAKGIVKAGHKIRLDGKTYYPGDEIEIDAVYKNLLSNDIFFEDIEVAKVKAEAKKSFKKRGK